MSADPHSPDEIERYPWDVLETVVGFGLLLLTSATVTGLILSIAGWFTPGIFFGCVAVVAIGTTIVVRRAARGDGLVRAAPLNAAMTLALVVATTLVSARFAAEHLLTDRDPGVYVTTARWLASHGSLLIDGAVGGFAGSPGIDAWSQGLYIGRLDGLVYAQFQHGLPVVMAIGRWIGGDGLLLNSVGLLMGAAVAAFVVFGRTVLRPGWAVLATAMVVADLVTLHFGRDAYSESLFMAFLFGGLWLLDRAHRSDNPTLAGASGILLGAMALVRIDAWLALTGIFIYLFFALWTGGMEWRSRLKRFVGPVAGGIVVTASLGAVDLVLTSPDYLVDLWPTVRRMIGGVGSVVAVGVLVSVLARPWRWSPGSSARRWQSIAGTVTALSVLAAAGYLLIVRPVWDPVVGSQVNETIEGMQRAESIPLEGTRLYWEQSLRWIAWYMGIPALIAGVLGWAWTARLVVLGRYRRLAPFLLSFSIVTIVYLWRPSITPDHLFAMRRFLPVTIPGLVLFGVLLSQVGVGWLGKRWRGATGPAVLVLAVALLGPPIAYSLPLLRSTTQVGMYGVTQELCGAIPADAAVLITSQRLRAVYAHTVRAFCEVPVASAETVITSEDAMAIGERWEAVGTAVYVLADPADDCAVPAVGHWQIWYPEPERTLTRRPSASVDLPFGMSMYPLDVFREADDSAWVRCTG